MSEKRLAIDLIGIYPPPYGGVSVHIKRLKSKLEQSNIGCSLYDETRFDENNEHAFRLTRFSVWFLKYLIEVKHPIIHCHSKHWVRRFLITILRIFGKKVVITIHSLRENIDEFSMLDNFFVKYTFRYASKIIVTNTAIKNYISLHGCEQNKIAVIPAFIAPNNSVDVLRNIPPHILDFIDSHQPLVSANAYQIKFHNGEDLYGIDLLLALINQLKERYPRVGLVFALPEINDMRYFEKVQNEIVKFDIKQNILFTLQPLNDAWIIWKVSDIFIRPTNTDGDSVSIREAMTVGTPVITSNCVLRPRGCILFENRNVADLIKKVTITLENYEFWKNSALKYIPEDNTDKIISIYHECLKDKQLEGKNI